MTMPNDSDLRLCSIFQILPAEIKKGLDVMARERFDQAWINGGVYNDAHAS
jgi:hypothetical protein